MISVLGHSTPQRRIGPLLALLVLTAACSRPPQYHRWESIELSFNGPASQSLGQPNPFAVPFDVIFISPDAREFRVPGYYACDGDRNSDGNIWRVRFSADQNGRWAYRTDSAEPSLNAIEGAFEVVDPSPDAPDFYRWGRLEYVGKPYLKFREGGYWVKAGADDPENILGAAMGDWASKRAQIDYIAQKGINSLYVMTHNLDGDANDVWPWIGATSEGAKTNSDRFDIAKLEQWRDFFVYLQNSGIALYMVLEDDSAWTGYDRPAYYREMVARFGDLPAVYFNAGEEANENYSLEDSIGHMKLLASIDPYNHPRAIHNVRAPMDEYLDTEELNLTSIQTWPTSPARLNELGIGWAEASMARGVRPLVVNFDEARPAEDRRSVWPSTWRAASGNPSSSRPTPSRFTSRSGPSSSPPAASSSPCRSRKCSPPTGCSRATKASVSPSRARPTPSTSPPAAQPYSTRPRANTASNGTTPARAVFSTNKKPQPRKCN